MDEEDVKNLLLALASGAKTYGTLSGNTAATHAGNAAAGLILGVASLLKQRSTEEVRQLLYTLAADPADRVDLTGLQDHVDALIANRRAREAAGEEG